MMLVAFGKFVELLEHHCYNRTDRIPSSLLSLSSYSKITFHFSTHRTSHLIQPVERQRCYPPMPFVVPVAIATIEISLWFTETKQDIGRVHNIASPQTFSIASFLGVDHSEICSRGCKETSQHQHRNGDLWEQGSVEPYIWISFSSLQVVEQCVRVR